MTTKQAEMNFMRVFPTKCDCCGEMVVGFSSRGEWFGKYLNPEENRICHNCIKDRPGYAEEFKEKIGVSLEVFDAIQN